MKLVMPDFYPDFHCIGSACQDNCCISWEIDIDSETAQRYRQVGGALGERLQKEIDWEEPAHFRLAEKDRCPFLNAQNLCDLYQQLGEDSLCQICQDHPRFRNVIGDREEIGLGLCCEEAVRLLISHLQPLGWIEEETPEIGEEEPLLPMVLQVRAQLLDILQDRSQPLPERMEIALSTTFQIQQEWEGEAGSPIPWAEIWAAFWNTLEQMEILDEENWPILRERVKAFVQAHPWQEIHSLWETDWNAACIYEQLLVYFLYRYLIQAAWDGELLARFWFAVASVTIIAILDAIGQDTDGNLTQTQRVFHIKAYSKEVEYSEENLDACLEALAELRYKI
jgi:lysine-N-methylase